VNFWSRTLIYLGLREEPEDAVDWDVLESAGSGLPAVTPPSSLSRAAADRSVGRRGEESSNVRPIRSALDTSNDRIAVVQVRVFDDVESIGSRYRVRQPVLFDVSACGRDVARRAVDFVSGLTYASRGTMRRVGPRAFLLVPESVTVPDSERRRLEQLGYDLSVDVTR
jgi:FtsZ-interacting cell division protein YlmF